MQTSLRWIRAKRHSTLLENIEMFGPEKGRLDNGYEDEMMMNDPNM